MVGKRVYLLGCPATTDKGDDVSLIGLFDVEEFLPVEPSNYVWSAGFIVFPKECDDEFMSFFVDGAHLWEQTNPRDHARILANERDMDNWELEQF